MGLRLGSWKTVTIAKDADPAISAETDLGGDFRSVQVYCPAIDTATLTVEPSRLTGDTPVQAYTLAVGGTDAVNTTANRATAGMVIFRDLGARYVSLLLSAVQTTAARTFYIRGIDPL